MIEYIKVVLLGIVEGITEFLPISSTGHLNVAIDLLQPAFTSGVDDTFNIVIQLGAVIAVLLYYARDLFTQARAIPTDAGVRRFWLHVLIAVVPAAVIGLLARDFIKATLFSPGVIALSLITGGIVFILLERSTIPQRATQEGIESVTLRQAVIIGAAQTIALIPGVSRSAASMIAGMGVGLTRSAATRFSFYLAIPTLGGATMLELLLSLDEIRATDWPYMIVGLIVSGVVAYFAIGWLLRYVSKHTLTGFGWYRIIAGVVILLLMASGTLV